MGAERLPVSPSAMPAAGELLGMLRRLSGRGMLAGQHNQPVHGSAWTQRLTGLAGAVPPLWGQEIGFSAPGTLDGVDRRELNIAEAIAWDRRGGVVTYTWHAVCPPDDEPVEFDGGILRDLPVAEFDAILDPGSRLHSRWEAQVDVAAGLLRRLQDAGVAVLWRPYHEMNGSWFWWGGQPERFVALWRQLFTRFTGHHGLANLVWVWSPNSAYGSAAPFAPFFPGHDVVDALGVDTYGGHYEREHYEALLDLAGGKPVGFGEVGELPTPEILDDQPLWSWFMTWPEVITDANDRDHIRRLYADPRVVTLGDMSAWRPSARPPDR
jgi:mannan endo-1,4-beta-mannosidase